jgi:hypothetical protein
MYKYPVLRTLALVARVCGWIAIVIAGLLCLLAIFGSSDVSQNNPLGSSSGNDAIVRILLVVVALVIAGFGLWLVILGEMIQVFLDVEENTRDSVTRLRAVEAAIAGTTPGRLPHETPPTSPTCPSCGAKNDSGSKFCEHCGKAL